jgi:hypothetical protein
MEEDNLSEQTRNLRTDVAFERQEGSRRIFEVIEFSCQYNDIMREAGILKHVFGQRRRKYAKLMRELSQVIQQRVPLPVIIVPSLGAVYLPSLKQPSAVPKCHDRRWRKLGRRMSERVIRGSMESRRQFAVRMVQVRRRREDGNRGEEVEADDGSVEKDESEEMKEAK